jgi:response regulator RpfG family c-di-GMP phosphodiesterase
MTLENFFALSVDDNEVNLMLIESMADNIGLNVQSFLDPLQALSYAQNNTVDIAFVDYMMPEMDGISFIRELRHAQNDIPIIMITAMHEDEAIRLEALTAGATEFLYKPLNTSEFLARVQNLLALRQNQRLLQDKAFHLEFEIRKATQEISAREFESLTLIGRAAEYKDTETGNHIRRVASYSRLLAEKLGQSAEFQDAIFHAAPLHDIGKIGIPDAILLKPAKLTPEEFEIMKTHTTIGFEIARQSKSKYLKLGAVIALAHHEKWDGSGYPKGLAGEAIPLMGRITTVADVFDALTSTRPYKRAWSFEEALNQLKKDAGTHFDPTIIATFAGCLSSVQAIYEQFKD